MSSNPDFLSDRATVGFDPVHGTYNFYHDETGTTPLSYSILRGVAAITGDEPHDLDPLTEIVDPDALDRLFQSESRTGTGPIACLSFEFNGCQVTVHEDDKIVIKPPQR